MCLIKLTEFAVTTVSSTKIKCVNNMQNFLSCINWYIELPLNFQYFTQCVDTHKTPEICCSVTVRVCYLITLSQVLMLFSVTEM
jgi:hypothetical protein